MEYNRENNIIPTPKSSRSPSVSSLQDLSPNKQLFKSAFARSLKVQLLDQAMPNQSTPVAFKKYQKDTEMDFHCARKSLDCLETQLSRINISTRPNKYYSNEGQPRNNDAISIKNMMLEGEVEKLKWQLELAENSRTMYHELMEDMILFLERCNRDLDTSQDSSDSSSSTGQCSSRLSGNFTKESESSDDFAESSSLASYKKYKEYYSNRNTKRQPEPPAAARISKEAYRLLRIAQNLVNTREPDLRQSIATPIARSKKILNVAQSPRRSAQKKALFSSPSKDSLHQSNSKLFWEKAEGRSPRLSLPLIQHVQRKEGQISSTEDEGIGGSVRSIPKSDSKVKDIKRTGTYRSFLAKQSLLKRIASVDLIGTK